MREGPFCQSAAHFSKTEGDGRIPKLHAASFPLHVRTTERRLLLAFPRVITVVAAFPGPLVFTNATKGREAARHGKKGMGKTHSLFFLRRTPEVRCPLLCFPCFPLRMRRPCLAYHLEGRGVGEEVVGVVVGGARDGVIHFY